MTRELVKKCSAYEKAFNWAINSNFVRMSNAEFSAVAALYTEALGKGLSASQMTCNTCRLNAMKTLGKEYFKWKEFYAEEDKKDKAKKKVGRPPKINLDQEQTEPNAEGEESKEQGQPAAEQE